MLLQVQGSTHARNPLVHTWHHRAGAQAAMEIIFLEASQVVLEEFRPAFFSDRLFCLFFDNMQQ